MVDMDTAEDPDFCGKPPRPPRNTSRLSKGETETTETTGTSEVAAEGGLHIEPPASDRVVNQHSVSAPGILVWPVVWRAFFCGLWILLLVERKPSSGSRSRSQPRLVIDTSRLMHHASSHSRARQR